MYLNIKDFVKMNNILKAGAGQHFLIIIIFFFSSPLSWETESYFDWKTGEGGNKNQCVKPLVTSCWRTNIDKCKGLVVLLFCMSISSLSHKACLYFQEACPWETKLLQCNSEENV